MASGSNAPVITNVLVAWPPPPSSARFGGASPPSTARHTTRFSLAAAQFGASFPVPPPASSPPPPPPPAPAFPGATPLAGYAAPRAELAASTSSGSGGSTPVRARSVHKALSHGAADEGPLIAPAPRREYPPPKAPLSPAQLGRIAQSFGIAAPKSPAASPRSSPSRRHGRNDSSARGSPVSPSPRSPSTFVPHAPVQMGHAAPSHVVAVVPPQRLLARVADEDAVAETERRRRWRRGRLIPLQPTLGAMLVAIAREFGLPSTIGISVFLGGAEYSSRTSLSSVDDDTAGPEITPATWTTLFAHAARKSVSPTVTPVSTPRKRNASAATFGAIMNSNELAQADRVKSLPSTDTGGPSCSGSSASSFSPRTPASTTNMSGVLPVFGTIEFDVDPTQARWLDEWLKSGGASRRKTTPGSEIAVMRELTLVERLKDPRPKFLRQMEEERERAQSLAAEQAAERAASDAREAARVAAERKQDEDRRAQQVQLEREEAEREAALQLQREAHQADLALRALSGDDGETVGESKRAELPSSSPIPFIPTQIQIEDADLPEGEVSAPRAPSTFFSQPAAFLFGNMLGANYNENRASGLLMADQLSSLEKMVRDLSPKESRFTSTRTPPQPSSPRSPAHSTALSVSPVYSTFGDLPPRGSSRLPYLSDLAAAEGRQSTDSSGSDPQTPATRGEWPAVPFKDSPTSPGLKDYFKSSENGSRLQAGESEYRTGSYNGGLPALAEQPPARQPPPRPARPPTPDLSMPMLHQHVLPSEFVDAIKHPAPPPSAGAGTGLGNRLSGGGARPMSMSIKAIRRQTSNHKLRPKDRAHAYAVANARPAADAGQQPLPQSSHPRQASTATTSTLSRGESLGSYDDAQAQGYQPFPAGAAGGGPSGEFAMATGMSPVSTEHALPQASSLPSRKEGGFTSRFFSFGGRKSAREAEENRMTIVHISSPIATSVRHTHVTPAELAASGAAGGLSAGPLPAASAPAPPSIPVAPPPAGGTLPSPPASGVTAPPAPATPPPAPSAAGATGSPSPTSKSNLNGAPVLPHADERASLPNSPTSLRVRRKPVPGIEGEGDSQYEGSVSSLQH